MRIVAVTSLFLIPSLIAFGASPKVSQRSASPSTVPTSNAAAPARTIPSYPNTPAGLESFVKDMMKLEKNGDHQALASYAKSLMLPDAENWFTTVFGEEKGRALVAASDRLRSETELSVPDMLAEMLKQKRDHIQAVLLEDSCKSLTEPEEYSILLLRQRPEVLYDVRFMDRSSVGSIWRYLAYVDGGFRYVGNFRKGDAQIQQPNLAGSTQSNSVGSPPEKIHVIRVGGNVQAAQLVCQVMPNYPEEARSQRIQGNVILHAIIDKDGTITHLEPISGPPDLIAPSVQAVRRWRYKPTLFNGEPVQVDTTITVVFALGPTVP